MKLPTLSRKQIIIGIFGFIFLLFILLIVKSSNGIRKDNDVVIHVSDTDQEEKPRRSNYYESPIDIVNKEILNENPDLQKLEEEIKNSKIEQYSLSKQLTAYKDRFDRLYNSTQNIAKEIIDSSAQKSMKVHIQLQIDNYTKKNNASTEEPIVKIYRGVMYAGVIDKNIIGCVNGTIIQALFKEYNTSIACAFVNGIQKLANAWLLLNSFSIGLKDCLMLNKEKELLIKNQVRKCIYEAESLKNEITNPHIKEARINANLNKAKDIGFKIAKESILPTNGFLSTIKSGSKGEIYNLCQMLGLLSQQNLRGSRIQPSLNNKTRTLPHYPFDNLTPEQEYESKGFISSPFIRGLNPREFYFHACSGREGVSDTSLGTASSGYLQRRIIKLTEDMKVEYDGSIRDAGERVYQFAYGENNLDPSKTIVINGNNEICDVGKIIDKLNMKVDMEHTQV